MGEGREYRVHVSVRRRGESIADSIEVKTELCNSLDEVYDNIFNFVESTISALEEGDDDNSD